MSQEANIGNSGTSFGARIAAPARGRRTTFPLTNLWAIACGALVLGAAVGLRWPLLLTWPAFTDETREVLLALSVARGERIAWTSVNSYIGPAHVYLTAAALALTQHSLIAPRLLMLGLNLIAVACTWRLATRLGGRNAGLIAGLLAAIAPMWVFNNSHVAWSANTTPTYVMAALLCADAALSPRGDAAAAARVGPAPWTPARGLWLVAAGVLLGLAGQAHPTGWFAAVGIGLAVVWGRDGWRRLGAPWPWASLLAMALVYSPVLLHATIVAPATVAAEAAKIGGARGLGADLATIAARAPGVWWQELRMVAGVAEPSVMPAWSTPGIILGMLLSLALATWGARRLLRQGEPLVPLSAAAWLLLPVLTAQSGEIFVDRYAAPLVGILAVLIGVGIVTLARGRRAVTIALAVATALLPLGASAAFLPTRPPDHNQMAGAVADLLAPSRGCVTVLLDQASTGQVTPGGGSLARALRLTLGLAGVPHGTYRVHAQTMRDLDAQLNSATPGRVVVAVLTPPTIAQISAGRDSRLTAIATTPDDSSVAFTVYTYRATALPTCAPPPAPPLTPDQTDDTG